MAALTIADRSAQADTVNPAVTTLVNKLLGLYDRGGVAKRYRFTYINDTGAALADGSIVKLCTVGPGLICPDSEVTSSAFGSSRTLEIGTQEYTDTELATVVSDIDAILPSTDISSAVLSKKVGTVSGSLTSGDGLVVTGQVDILAKVSGGTIPTSGTLEGFINIISN